MTPRQKKTEIEEEKKPVSKEKALKKTSWFQLD
jgi:hypothetical protein